MPRLNEQKRNELEAFWRAHIQSWSDSTLNQREYCEAHGLPLKRFGNWRAKLRGEVPPVAGKLLYRRGEGSEHMLKHMPCGPDNPYIPSGRSGDACRRRNFGMSDKRRVVEDASRPGASVSGVAKKHWIGPRLLFQWKKDLVPDAATVPVFAEVKLSEVPDAAAVVSAPPFAPAPVVVERTAPGIEVDLKGGRRVPASLRRREPRDLVRRQLAAARGSPCRRSGRGLRTKRSVAERHQRRSSGCTKR